MHAASAMYFRFDCALDSAAAIPLPEDLAPGVAATVALDCTAPALVALALVDDEMRPELVSRRRRFRSARISAADWQRRSRSFSSALLITSSSFGGKSGFRRIGGVGARFRIASVITPVVSPRKGSAAVAIS